jgi:hypothetical protein
MEIFPPGVGCNSEQTLHAEDQVPQTVFRRPPEDFHLGNCDRQDARPAFQERFNAGISSCGRGSRLPAWVASNLEVCLHRDRPIRRDQLAAAVWEERAPANPDAALRVVLSRLRRALGADALPGRTELRLALPEPAEVDVERRVGWCTQQTTATSSRGRGGRPTGAKRAASGIRRKLAD